MTATHIHRISRDLLVLVDETPVDVTFVTVDSWDNPAAAGTSRTLSRKLAALVIDEVPS